MSFLQEVEDEDNFGLCVLDAATGEFNLCSFVDDVCRTKLETMMRQLRPKELVHTKARPLPSFFVRLQMLTP